MRTLVRTTMKKFSSLISLSIIMFLFMLIPAVSNLQASQIFSEPPVYSRIYDARRNPNADGRDALKLAQKTNRKVLIEVGGDWCSWCHIMDRFIKAHPNVESRLHETFVVLKINVSDANDNIEFMAAFPPPRGYPHMYITDSTGTILYSQDTANFREDGEYSEQHFMVFFDHWQTHDE